MSPIPSIPPSSAPAGPPSDDGAPTGPPGPVSPPSRRSFLTGVAALGGAAAVGVAAAPAAAADPVAAPAPTPAPTAAPAPAPVPAGPPGAGGLGFVLAHEQFRTDQLVDWAGAAQRAGFASVWTSDHIQPWQPNQGHAMFPWNTLALVGDRTTRLRFGTGVTCPIYRHHPTQVAQVFASLGVLSPGRVFLGVGTGEALNERAATGQFGPYAERAARLVEAVTLIRELWTGRTVTFRGTYYRTDNLKLWDLPAQPVPIYIAASGPKSAYLAGRHGDGWITSSSDYLDPSLRAAFEAGARAAGRNPATMPRLTETFVVVGNQADAEAAARLWRFTVNPWGTLVYQSDPARIQAIAEQRWPLSQVTAQWPVSTDPKVHIRALQRLIDLGATPYIHSGQPDQLGVIDFYGAQVIPRL